LLLSRQDERHLSLYKRLKMVVPVSQEFTRALTEPLEVIQELFEATSDRDAFTKRVHDHFNNLFDKDQTRAKVPFLTQATVLDPCRSAQLVRWRCMVQDTSLGNEVLPRQIRTADGRVRNGLFGAASKTLSGLEEEVDNPSEGGFSSLTTICGVSLPGQTLWSREEDGDNAEQSSGSASLKEKLPRPEEGTSALLKIYDEQLAESLHVAQVVDVLGVLDVATLPAADWTHMGSRSTGSGDNSEAPTPTFTTLHVIAFKESPTYKAASTDAKARDSIVDMLASQTLGGDKLAAEYILLAMLARIHTRTAAHALGGLTVNLSSFLSRTAGNSADSLLIQALRSLLPLVAEQSLDLNHLNAPSTRFAPKSEADERGLLAGRLQLIKGTLLFIDESTMNEGQLKDNGIANVRALSDLLTTHKLAYAFPFSSHEMDTDLPCVVISQGKSFLPIDVQIPLQADEGASLYGQLGKVDEEQLRSLRRYLSSTAYDASSATGFSIPSQVSERIQDDFVDTRKANQASTPIAKLMDTQEDLARLIQIARLVCLSKGRQALEWDDWQAAKYLEEQRQIRLTASPATQM
jgi:hypothetical protein